MSKQEFLAELKARLSGLPQSDIEERLIFFGEMIDDRIEEGLTEEEAVSAIGTVDEVAGQIVAETPLTKLVKERVKPKRSLRAWEIVLLVLGSPIWLSVLIAVFAVIFAVYVAIWSVIISLWAILASLAVSSLAAVAAAVVFSFNSNWLTGAAMLGAGIFCAGLTILLFFGCKAATKGVLLLTKNIALGIKSLLVGKEGVK